ncbi:MAG: DNA polymerase III subunit delta [Aquamicrobium sp.]|uniref:DNA polymerase III subunit delta n=1 Tax=Aquamicrobium sp. TaxID=1872579 RepID=UPI00349EDA47|nr:DNA polymerase III subunit delta [Aquamicrobium sp.]
MAQKKAHEVDSWLRNPDPGIGIVLIYGPDRGLVAERAKAFVAKTGLAADDPFSSIRLEASELEAAPGRLLDEAATVPMFSARRLIWVKGAGSQKQLAEDVKALVAAPPRDSVVLIEAGDLKKGAALRSTVENGAAAMALPCYVDEGKAIDAVIDEILGREGLSIGLEARQALRASLGGDRLASRSEVEKLALYCRGGSEIRLEDVRTMTGDVSGLGIDDAVDAVLSGNGKAFDASFTRLVSAGTHPFLVLAAAMRQFQLLQLMRAEMDTDAKPAAAVVASARPPVFFTRRRLVEAAPPRWRAPAIARALERLQATVLLTRQRADLAAATARQALIALLVESARGGR